VILHMCSQYILFSFTSSIIHPFPSTPFLEQFQLFSVFYFQILIQSISTIYALIPPFIVPNPSYWHPLLDMTYFSLLPSYCFLCVCVGYFLFLLFIYSHVHTLFGSFLHTAPPFFSPLPHLSPLPASVPGRSCSALITNFVEQKT
jgi:hypothetical protein